MESEISKIHKSEHFHVFALKKLCERSQPLKKFSRGLKGMSKLFKNFSKSRAFEWYQTCVLNVITEKILRARMLHFKTQNSYTREAILCEQNIAFSSVFTTFFTSNGSKFFSKGHIHVIWVLERSALMSSFDWYQAYNHTMCTEKNLRANRKNARWVTNWISVL